MESHCVLYVMMFLHSNVETAIFHSTHNSTDSEERATRTHPASPPSLQAGTSLGFGLAVGHCQFFALMQGQGQGNQTEHTGSQLPHLVTPPRHRHVQAIVTADIGVRPAAPGLKGFEEGAAFLRNGEVKDHGGTSSQGGLQSQEGSGQLVVRCSEKTAHV